MLRKNKVFNCTNCGEQFFSNASNAKYCRNCSSLVRFSGIAATHNSRAKRGCNVGVLTAKELFDVYHSQGKYCLCCGSDKIYFDHVVPLSVGGTNTANNLQLLCSRCNNRKRQQIIDYRAEVLRLKTLGSEQG